MPPFPVMWSPVSQSRVQKAELIAALNKPGTNTSLSYFELGISSNRDTKPLLMICGYFNQVSHFILKRKYFYAYSLLANETGH